MILKVKRPKNKIRRYFILFNIMNYRQWRRNEISIVGAMRPEARSPKG